MRTPIAVGFGLILSMGLATGARAQVGGTNYQELFQQLDANGDLVIDRGEVPESGRAAFETLLKNGDANKDGKIDRDEYRNMLGSLRDAFSSLGKRFSTVDANGDGTISRDEFKGPEGLFARIDANGDGGITRDEADRFRPGQGDGNGLAMFAQRVKAMDKNGDGTITREEFTGPPPIFDRLDADKDGVLSRSEIPGGNGNGNGPATKGAGTGERFRAMDRNSDGKLGKDEFQGPPQLFDRLDANSDGFLTPDELRRAAPGAAKAKRST